MGVTSSKAGRSEALRLCKERKKFIKRAIDSSRWGRVGVKGQDKLNGPYKSAIREFEQKFYAKTKNRWSNRREFVCHPKSYAWLEMDYTKTEKKLDVQANSNSTIKIQPRETKLDDRVAKFIDLICNVSTMKQNMMEIGYNAEKLPLGKLSKSTILKGPNGSTLPGPCDSPALIRFFMSSNLVVSGLRIQNSPQFDMKFDGGGGSLFLYEPPPESKPLDSNGVI